MATTPPPRRWVGRCSRPALGAGWLDRQRRGEVLRDDRWGKRVSVLAVREAGLGIGTPHRLRHASCSGHVPAAMAADVCAGLFDGDLDASADLLDGRSPGSWRGVSRDRRACDLDVLELAPTSRRPLHVTDRVGHAGR